MQRTHHCAVKENGETRPIRIMAFDMEEAERKLKAAHPDATSYAVWNPDHWKATT